MESNFLKIAAEIVGAYEDILIGDGITCQTILNVDLPMALLVKNRYYRRPLHILILVVGLRSGTDFKTGTHKNKTRAQAQFKDTKK